MKDPTQMQLKLEAKSKDNPYGIDYFRQNTIPFERSYIHGSTPCQKKEQITNSQLCDEEKETQKEET